MPATNMVSTPVFARVLNTRQSTGEPRETGAKRHIGMARKLLALVQRHGLRVRAWGLRPGPPCPGTSPPQAVEELECHGSPAGALPAKRGEGAQRWLEADS